MTAPDPGGLPAFPTDPRARHGLLALHACIRAAKHWDPIGPAARSALTRAHQAATPDTPPALPATIHTPTRLRLTRAGLTHPDGTLTRLGIRVTAWSTWAARGDALGDALEDAIDRLPGAAS